MSYFFRVPASNYAAAIALQRAITGRPDDPPIFEMSRARGTSRADAWLYAHGRLWTPEQTEEFTARISEVGGFAKKTYDGPRKLVEPVEEMMSLGDKKRPDLERLTVAQIRAIANKSGIENKSVTRKSDLIDLLESADELP